MASRDRQEARDPTGESLEGTDAAEEHVPDKPGNVRRMLAIAAAAFVSVGGAWYFYTNRGVWSNTGERFYVLIFAVLTVVSVAYLLRRVRTRRRWRENFG